MSRRSLHLPPLSSATYIVLFLVMTLVLFTAMGAWMVQRLDTVKQVAAQSYHDAAEEETRKAVEMVMRDARSHAMALAEWGETRQQLADPTYYAYWRENRAHQSGLTPPYAGAIELYNRHGQALVKLRHDAELPPNLPEQNAYLRNDAGTLYLYLFQPIGNHGQAPIGHIGLKLDFLRAMFSLNRFRYADPQSLTVSLKPEQRIPLAAIDEHLTYKLLPRVDTTPLEQVMTDTLTHFTLLALLLVLTSYLLMHALLGSPMRRLVEHIDALRRGESGPLASEQSPPLPLMELEKLRLSINGYQEALDEMYRHLDSKNEELWQLAHHDPLTGVFNRRAYDEDWRHLQSLVAGRRTGVSILLFDCDHFKAINDTYGHDVGDKVIQAVADSLLKALRDGDRLYRLGGDEFAVQLLDTSEERAERIARRCLDLVHQYPFRDLGIREPVRFSVGIAFAEGTKPTELMELHRRADVAMYRAKRPGPAKVVSYSPEMADGSELLVSSRYLNAVHQVIESGIGLEFHYQPIVNLTPDHDSFYEALVRIRDEEGLISPAHIFPVVEAQHLECEFDLALLRHINAQMQSGALPPHANLSINLSPPSLNHPEVIAQLEAMHDQLRQRLIMLEVTETTLISKTWRAADTLRRLREVGFTIGLDDFGSGYSSFRYLATMPVDIVKFDITMVRDLERDAARQDIVKDVAHMIRKAGYQLVAEGIETDSLLHQVKKLGFTHAQGYLFGRAEQRIATLPTPPL